MTNTMTLQNTPTRTMQVTGRGNLSVAPDTTRIVLHAGKVEPSYADALEASAKETEILRKMFVKLGFNGKDLKTTSFHVDTKYEGHRNPTTDAWEREFKGYEYNHRMKIEFANNNDLLGQVLYALAHSKVHAEFHISYTIANPEPAKNALLAKAVADGRTKAEVLAAASGVKLGNLLKVDYSWGEIIFNTGDIVMEDMGVMQAKSAGYEMDIEPEDIELTDTVTLVWEIQ